MSWLGMLREVLHKTSSVSLDERRRAPRLDCELEATCRTEDRDLPALVLDLSSTGMKLRLNRTLRVGSEVRVSAEARNGVLEGRQRLVCRVSWVRPLTTGGSEAGLCIQDSTDNQKASWVARALHNLTEEELQPRRHRRFETSQTVGVGMVAHSTYAVMVDLGLGGAQIQLDQHVAVGAVLLLDIQDENTGKALTLAARVVSSRRHQGQFSWVSLKFYKLDALQEQGLRRMVESLAREEASDRRALAA